MDKIKALLEQSGCRPELTGQICTILEQYKLTLKEQYSAEYDAKVAAAKKICMEEFEASQRSLAHRVQIFCETKGNTIEASIAKQSALNESAAVAKLRSVASVLHGITPNGSANGQVTADIEKLKRRLKAVTEEKNAAIAKANRQTAIAEKALSRNRQLESTIARPLTESRVSAPATKRIDTRRTASGGAAPARTARPTLLENHSKPASKSQRSNVDIIADSIDID